MDECKLSSMSRPPFTGVVDSTSLTNTNSQSDYMSDFTLLSSTTSVKEIKTEPVMDSTYYTGVETNLNRCEDIEESIENKTGCLMNQEEKDILINMKQEDEEGGERQSGARDEVRLWKKEEIKKDEQEEYGVTQQVTQTVKCEKNEGKSEDGQQEGEELSTLATSCLLNQPRVLIRRLEMADNSLPVQIAPLSIASKRGQGTRSPWKLHELSPQRGNGSLWQEGHVVTRKRRTVSQLDRSLKVRPSSSDKEISTEASFISPAVSPRNQNTATLPSMDKCELSSMSRPPFTGVVDSTSLIKTNSQSDYMSDFTLLSSTTSVKEIKTESVMDSTGVETRSNLNRCDDIEESVEKKTVSLMNQEEKDILINMKQEDEEGGERQSGARDEVRLWKKEEIKKDEQEEYGVTQQVTQTVKCEKNEGKSEDGQQEVEDLSTLATSCLLNQPRVLIRRLEMADNSLPVQIAPLSIASKRGQGTRSPRKLHELSPQMGTGALWQEGHVVTRKRRTVSQLDRPLKVRPSSSDKEISTEASFISPAISPRNQNTGNHKEVNLHPHIETVHPEEDSRALNSGGNGAEKQLPPSSTHQHPTPPKTLPTSTTSHTGTPGTHICSQCGKADRRLLAATLPSMDKCELSSMSRPPFTGVVDSTSLIKTNSQSDYMSDFTLLSSTTSVKEIKTESVMDSTYYTGVEMRSNLNRCEDIEESIENKTGGLMNQEEKDVLINMKQEDEEGGERQSGAGDEVRLWKKEEIKKDEQEEYGVTQQVTQTVKWEKNEGKSEDGQQEGEELFTLATSCLLNQPRVLIRRLEMADNSLHVQIAPLSIAGKRGQGTRSPWKLHELSPQRGNGSLWQEGHVVTRKRRTVGQLDRPLKVRPSSSAKEISTEASFISPAISPRNQNTGNRKEVNLHPHIETVHPEEDSRALNSGGNRAEKQLPPSSTHQHPKPPKTLPTPTTSHTGTLGTHICSQCGKDHLKKHQHTGHTGTQVQPDPAPNVGRV
ncbi:hypothetical protein SKAU_G00423510 [Synaphobranchus kaupii]|uniref:Uncharacterized protein n=1 Tax=Synaphobranchus kaupii TaxID=118154 RepID=A0A9Q1E5E7_SYNKA|nr:hypothetical protein SKAU_G00423510 [Synaphobranchus kaupii]